MFLFSNNLIKTNIKEMGLILIDLWVGSLLLPCKPEKDETEEKQASKELKR